MVLLRRNNPAAFDQDAIAFLLTHGQKADPSNFLLMHAMGPNVAGVIGTAMVAGYFIAILGG